MTPFAALLLSLTITALPPTPLVETTKSGQALNFDFLLENTTGEKLELTEVEASVLGTDGTLITQRRLGGNGASIATLPQRELAPGAKMVVFNPFAEFESDIPLQTIRYDFNFDDKHRASITVKPQIYALRANLILPVPGRVFVHDGHDFYSHHRRLDVTGGMTTALGIKSNMTRYAYDFTVVDEKGAMHRGDGMKNEDWPSFGAPVVAPADGIVVKAARDRPDGSKAQRAPLDREAVMKNVFEIMGNHAVIDHGNGEFSLLAHMKQGTVTVKPGDRVKQGQKLGEIGCSGDAMFPHLHYQLQRDDYLGEGLPSYFRDYQRFTGPSWVTVKRGHVDTGDIVRSTVK